MNITDAARNGELDSMRFIISGGVDVNKDNWEGQTPLLLASEAGNNEMVMFLLANGANIKHADLYGNTALHLACSKGYLDVVTVLVESGAPIDITNKQDRNTPLHEASLKARDKIVKYLLSKGANKLIHNARRQKPIDCAQSLQVVDLLQ